MSPADAGPLVFLLLTLLTIGSALIVALSPNIIHSTIALLGTFLGVAGLYVQLSADFLAATQVLVYVGGTLTLLLFAVMLTARIGETGTSNAASNRGGVALLVLAVLFILGKITLASTWVTKTRPPVPSTAKLGHALLGEYVVPFEVGSVLLLAALVAAVVLARRAIRFQEGDVPSAAAPGAEAKEEK